MITIKEFYGDVKDIDESEMCIKDRDGIDSSKDAGKLMISVLSAVAEICLLYTSRCV